MLEQVLAESPAVASRAGLAPVIRPTRQRLDRRFPSLGFTVVTGGLPLFEVFVAKDDPGLFDQARAHERTERNWYASGVDGLTPAVDGRGRFIVPISVLGHLLNEGGPEVTLWCAAVAYQGPGLGATPMSRPAPVTAVAGFRPFTSPSPALAARGLARAFGQSPQRLRPRFGRGLDLDDLRAGEDGRDITATESASPAVRSQAVRGMTHPAAAITPIEDRRQGEDAGDLIRPPAASAPAPAPPPVPTPPPVVPTPPGPAMPTADPSPLHPPPPTPAPEVRGPAGPDLEPVGAPQSLSTPREVLAALTGGPAATAAGANASTDGYEDGWEDVAGPLLTGFAAGDNSSAYPGPLADEWDDLVTDDRLGPVPAPLALDLDEPATAPGTPARPNVRYPTADLASEHKRRIIEVVAGGEGGNGYVSINADGAFKGRFGPEHKAYQRYHTGLSYGIAGFNQDSGSLGQLALLMRTRDPEVWDRIMGPDAALLLAVITAPGPSSELAPGGRGPRVQPVAQADLWEAPWIERFRAAGRHPAFQAAQNQLCAELFLDPMLPLAVGFGLDTERGIGVLLDRAISLGVDVAKRWVADTIGPIRTAAMRQQALAALGFESVEALQRAVPELLVDGEFGPLTHATMTAGLRALGPTSPVPVPTMEQMLDTLVDRSQREARGGRVGQLRSEPALGDVPLTP